MLTSRFRHLPQTVLFLSFSPPPRRYQQPNCKEDLLSISGMLQSNGRKNLQKKKINETQKFKFNPFRISRKNVLDLPFYGSLGQTLYFSLKKQKKPLKNCLYRPCQFLAWSNFISIFKKKQEKTGKTFEFPCVTQLSIYQIFFLFSLFLQVLAALGHAAAAEEEGRAYEVRRCPRVLQWLAGNQEKTTTITTRTITRTRTLDVQRPQGEKDRSSSVEKTCCNGALYKKRKKNCRAKKTQKCPQPTGDFSQTITLKAPFFLPESTYPYIIAACEHQQQPRISFSPNKKQPFFTQNISKRVTLERFVIVPCTRSERRSNCQQEIRY